MHSREKMLHITLNQTFRLANFNYYQKEIIEHILDKKNALVIMPTGGGKSLCYQLPALLLPGLTVVISPLISLMKDQVHSLTKRGISAEFINSSLSKAERLSRYRNISDGKYKLLYVAPERFRNAEFLECIRSREISLLALDEAHCISQWGNDFRPDYTRIAEYRAILGNPPIIALTATATLAVQQEIIEKAGITADEMRVFNNGITRSNLYLSVKTFYSEHDKFEAIRLLLEQSKGCSLVYFTLISGLESFAEYLDLHGIKYDTYHGKLSAGQRKATQERFTKSDEMILLATNAFGLGVDKGNIRTVIHAEIPDSVESYYQEIGRAGRDGKASFCHLMYLENDLAVQMQFIEWKNPSRSFILQSHNLLRGLGSNISAHDYESIQEKLVYKNKGDRRLDSVLNIFDRYGISTGSFETCNLRLTGYFPEEMFDEERIKKKADTDRKRLYFMLEYIKSPGCRRTYIHRYFNAKEVKCLNCDNCIT